MEIQYNPRGLFAYHIRIVQTIIAILLLTTGCRDQNTGTQQSSQQDSSAQVEQNDWGVERDLDDIKISDEDKITAKYEFIINYLKGLRIIPSYESVTDTLSSRDKIDKLIRELNRKYLLAITGNTQAKNDIDVTLKSILLSYHPPDKSEGQYNLGVLFFKLGEYTMALSWFRKAADNGYQPAVEKLKELNK